MPEGLGRANPGLIKSRIDKLDASDAIRLAVEKPDFAKELIDNPVKFAGIFNLSQEHVDALKQVRIEDFAELKTRGIDPTNFADTVLATNIFLDRFKPGKAAVY